VSGASGAHAATEAERKAFEGMADVALRGFGSVVGHLKEAQFPFAVALAALAVHNRAAYPAFDAANEKPFTGSTDSVLATTIGYHQFEGIARLLSAN
jgi:3-oxoacyl-[acyl-carrier-protein] synthase II